MTQVGEMAKPARATSGRIESVEFPARRGVSTEWLKGQAEIGDASGSCRIPEWFRFWRTGSNPPRGWLPPLPD